MIGWIILWASLFCPVESWHDVFIRSQSLSGTWDVTHMQVLVLFWSVSVTHSYSNWGCRMKWRVTTEAELLTNTVRLISEGFAPSPSVSFLHQQEVSSSLVSVEERTGHTVVKRICWFILKCRPRVHVICAEVNTIKCKHEREIIDNPVIFSFFSHSSQRES